MAEGNIDYRREDINTRAFASIKEILSDVPGVYDPEKVNRIVERLGALAVQNLESDLGDLSNPDGSNPSVKAIIVLKWYKKFEKF